LLLHSSYLPLGVPNGLVNHHAQGRLLHIHITVSTHLLQGLYGLDEVDSVVEWCAQVQDGDSLGVLLWERVDFLLQKKAFKRRARGTW
jgi:hypothetical protein